MAKVGLLPFARIALQVSIHQFIRGTIRSPQTIYWNGRAITRPSHGARGPGFHPGCNTDHRASECCSAEN